MSILQPQGAEIHHPHDQAKLSVMMMMNVTGDDDDDDHEALVLLHALRLARPRLPRAAGAENAGMVSMLCCCRIFRLSNKNTN